MNGHLEKMDISELDRLRRVVLGIRDAIDKHVCAIPCDIGLLMLRESTVATIKLQLGEREWRVVNFVLDKFLRQMNDHLDEICKKSPGFLRMSGAAEITVSP